MTRSAPKQDTSTYCRNPTSNSFSDFASLSFAYPESAGSRLFGGSHCQKATGCFLGHFYALPWRALLWLYPGGLLKLCGIYCVSHPQIRRSYYTLRWWGLFIYTLTWLTNASPGARQYEMGISEIQRFQTPELQNVSDFVDWIR